MTRRLAPSVRLGSSQDDDAERAVADVAAQLGGADVVGVLFFASAAYDMGVLGASIARHFRCPVAGCTTSGLIGPSGFQARGITAVGFVGPSLRMRPYLVAPLDQCESRALIVAERIKLDATSQPGWGSFGLLLVDGLSMAEERLAATLFHACEVLPIVGGSAGDDLLFRDTRVYFDGEMHSNAGVLTVFETTQAFTTFKFQHVDASERKLVVTSADSERRVVHEINGERAVDTYAAMVGVAPEALNATVYSKNPLVLSVGDECFVRSIRSANADGSMTFYCAMDEGMVLSIGQPNDALTTAARSLRAASEVVGGAELIIGCDCVLRRLEFESDGIADAVGRVYAGHKVIGFSTYGEQTNAMHVNQTFAGIALGGIHG